MGVICSLQLLLENRRFILEVKLLEMHYLDKEKNDDIKAQKDEESDVSNATVSFLSIRPAHIKPVFIFRSVCLVRLDCHTYIVLWLCSNLDNIA